MGCYFSLCRFTVGFWTFLVWVNWTTDVPLRSAEDQSCTDMSGILLASCMAGTTILLLSCRKMWNHTCSQDHICSPTSPVIVCVWSNGYIQWFVDSPCGCQGQKKCGQVGLASKQSAYLDPLHWTSSGSPLEIFCWPMFTRYWVINIKFTLLFVKLISSCSYLDSL